MEHPFCICQDCQVHHGSIKSMKINYEPIILPFKTTPVRGQAVTRILNDISKLTLTHDLRHVSSLRSFFSRLQSFIEPNLPSLPAFQ